MKIKLEKYHPERIDLFNEIKYDLEQALIWSDSDLKKLMEYNNIIEF